jgi:hypothetical protein
MSALVTGDICTLRNRTGLFVYAGIVSNAVPPRSLGRFVRVHRNPESICTGLAMAERVASPSFEPGDVVTAHDGLSATVVSDDIDAGEVAIEYVRRPHPASAPEGERWAPSGGVCTAERSALVLKNLNRFI